MSDSSDDLVSAYLSDAVRAGDTTAIKGTLNVSERVARYLIRFYEAMLPVMDDPTEHPKFQEIVRRNTSIEANRARREGDVPTMSAIKGVSQNQIDATGNDLIRDKLSREGAHVHIFGPKNSGKTSKAHYWVVDVCGGLFDVARSNLTALDGGDPYAEEESRIEGQYDTMRGFVEELHTEDKTVCRIIDEVSSAMNGYAFSKAAVEQQMSQAINATRKYTENGATNLITVSHRESLGDVHPIIIENADIVVQAYEGDYGRATVYKGHFDKSKVDLEDRKIAEIHGIPDTTVEHSDSIMAKWWWNADGYDYRVGLSSLEDTEGEGSDGESTEKTPCQGTNRHDERCGTLTDHESGFCQYHRHQADSDDENEQEAE